MDYPDTDEDITYQYDQCANGTGRLCSIQDPSGTTQYSYDVFGNVVTQLKTELGNAYQTDYVYDEGNRVVQIRYPNGRLVSYSRDSLGRVQQISTAADTTFTVAYTLTYRADGLLTALRYGNGIAETRQYDAAGRLSCLQWGSSLSRRCYSYDANGNVTALDNAATQSQYNYDVLNRLMQESGTQSYANYSYDANGNRLTRDGVSSNLYNYATASNRLTAVDAQPIQLDAAGNTVSDKQGQRRFEYNQRGQLSRVYYNDSLIATYSYNALGQRTRKEIEGITIFYHYDLNGLLLSESHASNTLYIDYLGFDNRPLAQLTTQKLSTGGLNTSEIVYLHSDHLNTPRIGTNALGGIVWQWQSDAFGVKIPVANQPNSSVVNLRFPGQFYDMETGLYYNYHRYYDPQTGRYITSDPIGLAGGLNTFGYVGGNPLKWVDSTGNCPWCATGFALGVWVNIGVQLAQNGGDWGQLNATSVILSGVAGALSGGLGTITAELTVASNIVANTAGSAAISAAQQATSNLVNGECVSDGIGTSALNGGIFGFFGSSAGAGYNAYFNSSNANSFLNTSNAVSGPYYPSIFQNWWVGGTLGGNLLSNTFSNLNQ